MKSYAMRIIKSKRSVLFILLLAFFTFIDLFQNVISGQQYIPAFGAFLAGSSRGHIGQILMIWFLPIYLLLIYADGYIQDYMTGYNNILIAKIGKDAYVRDKLVSSFSFTFFTIFIILTMNFVIAWITFRGGTFTFGLEPEAFIGNWLAYQSRMQPSIAYMLYIFNFSLLAGSCAMVCTSFALLFPDYKFAYPIAFFVWFIQISGNKNLALISQPFSETPLLIFFQIWLRWILIVIIVSAAAFLYKVKTDEL